LRQREVLALIGGMVTARPAGAQLSKVPTVGVLFGGSAGLLRAGFPPFIASLAEQGYRDGHNLAIEYRTAEGQYDRLPAMIADLVGLKTDVIVSLASPASLAAKAAASTMPVVFAIAADPVVLGLVASLNRPGGNMTGATFLSIELTAKQLELMHEFIPSAQTVGFLINPEAPDAVAQTGRAQDASHALGLTLRVVNARTEEDIDAAFAVLSEQRVGALLVGGDEFLTSETARIVELAARLQIPAVYGLRMCAVAGGLASYGASLGAALHQAGIYTGRILKGTAPADLPVVQMSKFELVINLKTAKALDLTVPQLLLARADEVIE
jgi:ABC-type uncharacterized transport system substrate-binding protein